MAEKEQKDFSSRQDLKIAENGAIFYARLQNSNSSWQKLVSDGANEFNKIGNKEGYSLSEISKALFRQGQAEYAKEVALINSVFGAGFGEKVDFDKYPDFINTINLLTIEKEKYARLLKNLQARAKGSARADTGASHFGDYLRDQIVDTVVNYIKSHGHEIITKDPQAFLDHMEKTIKRKGGAIDRAVTKVAESGSRSEHASGGHELIWEDIKNLLGSSQETYFKQDIYNRYKIKESLQNLLSELQSGQVSTTGKKKSIKNSLAGKGLVFSNEQAGRQVAGFVHEYFESAMSKGSGKTKNGVTYKIEGKTMQGNMMKTDNVLLFSTDITLDLDAILEKFSKQTYGGDGLEASRQKIESFYNEHLKKLDSTFVIYQNAKNYGLGDRFTKGFSGDSGDIEDLKKIDSFGGNKQRNIIPTVYKLFNTIQGAQMSSMHAGVEKDLRTLISEQAAYFLFDDWEQIGNQSSNSLHLFNLDGVNIPLSYLLIGLSKAVEDTSRNPSSFLGVHFSYKDKIIYESKITSEDMKKEGTKNIYHFWFLQAEAQKDSFEYEIRFMQNFKGYLQSLIQAIDR